MSFARIIFFQCKGPGFGSGTLARLARVVDPERWTPAVPGWRHNQVIRDTITDRSAIWWDLDYLGTYDQLDVDHKEQ